MNSYDVAIAGGGPVGLALAIELAQAGRSVVVLEARPDRSTLHSGIMGARSLNVASGRLLHRLGVLDDIKSRALWWFDPKVALAPKGKTIIEGFIGHFSGIGLKASNLDPASLGDPGFGGGAAAMADIADVLETAARAAGVTLRMDAEVTGYSEDGAGIQVEAGANSVRAQWLVACDGGRSRLRKLAGIGFSGTDAEYVGRGAAVEFAPGEEPPVSDWIETDHGAWLHAPRGRLHIVEYGAPLVDRTLPVFLEEIAESFERVAGRPIGLTRLIAGQRYTDAARQADAYRKGRLFLAGDAAHIHAPAGGQGLNQGFGDAACLAPLLLAVLAGSAPAESLDAYDAERRPIGAAILDWTRAQSALGRPDPNSRALRRVVANLLDSPASTSYVLRRLGGEW